MCPVELGVDELVDAVLVRCRALRIEPPGRIERIVGSARARFEQRFCAQTVERLGPQCAGGLEGLVEEASGASPGQGLLAQLKADPGRVGLETLLREIDKLAAVRALVNNAASGHARLDHRPPERGDRAHLPHNVQSCSGSARRRSRT